MKFKGFFTSRSKPKKPKSIAREFIETIVISGILAIFIITFVVQSFVVKGQSMEPSFYNGERLFVNKFIYRFTEPERGDVIIFTPDGAPQDKFIKRVIGLSGETVKIEDGKVWIDGKLLQENYIEVPITDKSGTYEVPEDHVFVLGDNRHPFASSDSRYPSPVGYVNYESIAGKAFITYWPLPNIRLISEAKYEN